MKPMSFARRRARWALALAAPALLAIAGREALFALVERGAFVTAPAGSARPDALGAPSRPLSFASGDRTLHASWVPAGDARAPALLVFHGDDEDVSRWAAVQAMLHAAGVASFVFDYSGYGASSGRPSIARLREDARAAHARFVALSPHAVRRVALGFSLGAGVLLDALDALQPPPDAVVIGAGFASARETAVATGVVPAWIAWLLPDPWHNVERIAYVDRPLLIVHSRSDELIPFADAQRLCAAARAPRRLVLVDGVAHDAPLEPARSEAFWAPVIDLLRSGGIAAGECR